jgi:hypothetical protein
LFSFEICSIFLPSLVDHNLCPLHFPGVPCLGLLWITAIMTFTCWFAWESWLMSRTSKVLSPTLMVHNILFWKSNELILQAWPFMALANSIFSPVEFLLLNCLLGWEGMKVALHGW